MVQYSNDPRCNLNCHHLGINTYIKVTKIMIIKYLKTGVQSNPEMLSISYIPATNH